MRPNCLKHTLEEEIDNVLSFLDCKIMRVDGSLQTSVFRKSSFSGLYNNFDTFLPINYKYNVISTLLYRGFMLCSNWSLINIEINKLKDIFIRNGYPKSVFHSCVRRFFEKLFRPKQQKNPEKKEISICLLYLGTISLKLRTKLKNIFKRSLPTVDFKVVFRSSCRMRSFFRFKDRVSTDLLSHLIYKFTCADCNASYLGETRRHYVVRNCEHLRISPFTGKPASNLPTSVTKHIVEKQCLSNTLGSFEIVTSCHGSVYRQRIQESLLIARDDPEINGQIRSVKLELF